MISNESMQQARELASSAVSNIFRQLSLKVDLEPIIDNEFTVHLFDNENKPALTTTGSVKNDLELLYFNAEGKGGFQFIAVMKTDQGELAISDSGKLIYETISADQNIDKVIVSTFPSRSSQIEEKPPLLTDNVSTLFAASGLDQGGMSTGFFAKDNVENRNLVAESIKLLRQDGEEYIVLDESRTFSHIFADSTWHTMDKVNAKDGILYITTPDVTYTLSADNYDEYGDLSSLLPFIEASRNIEREYTSLITTKALADSKGKAVNNAGLANLSGILQKSAEKIRSSHDDFNDKSAEIVDENQTSSPSISKDSDIEEKAKKSTKDLTKSKSRKR